MRQKLGMQLRQEIRQVSEISGGVTTSVFPVVEAMLLECSDYQRALEFVASRKKMTKYHSMVDFLFCEFFPEWRLPCMRFYNAIGKPLQESIDVEQAAEYEAELVTALLVAYELHCEKRCESWTWYCQQVKEFLAA